MENVKKRNKKIIRENKAKITGMDYLGLALYAFGGLGMEVLYAFLLEPAIYGTQMQDWTDNDI